MTKVALFVRLEAKPGKEAKVAEFLQAGLKMAEQENGTPVWFALQFNQTTFGIFDAFESEANRKVHLEGPIAKALMANASELLNSPPRIEAVEVLGSKITSLDKTR